MISRRSFLEVLGAAGAGLALGVFDRARVAHAGELKRGFEPNVFIHLAPSGALTLICARSEMGQGVRSSLPVLLADELGADLSKVTVVQADGDQAYGDQNTDGSSSVRNGFDFLRKLGATARELLVSAAAKKWRVPAERCFTENHEVVNRVTRARLPFGLLAEAAAALPLPDERSVKPRPRNELHHLGAELPLYDAHDYVTGQAKYGADVSLPGMLIAVIARPPVPGGKPKKLDSARALEVPGVKRVIELPQATAPFKFQAWGGVAVLAENTWAALKGRAELIVEWDEGPLASYDSDQFRVALSRAVSKPGEVYRNVGDAEKALGDAKSIVEAEYHVPHLAHLPMEPPAVLANVDGGRCELWASTQNPQTARTTAAEALKLPEANVTVHVTFLGGGFGRKSMADFVTEAVLLSNLSGKPVRVQWTREDDVRHDYYNTVNTQRWTAGLDEKGAVTALRLRTAFPPITNLFEQVAHPTEKDLQQGVLDVPFAVKNVRAEAGSADAHCRIGWLRSVYNIFHAFALGSFVDELAVARKQDTLETWLELLGPPRLATLEELGVKKLVNYGASLEDHPVDARRLRGVLERAARLSGWEHRDRQKRALGLAAHRSFVSYAAVVVSAVKSLSGKVGIDEAWIVLDAGQLVNADRVRAQMEGALVFGLSHALWGGVTMKKGVTEQSNFHDQKLVRMPTMPKAVHIELVQSDEKPGGVGEPGVPPVAPAVANAVFALTGKRIRRLPLSAEL